MTGTCRSVRWKKSRGNKKYKNTKRYDLWKSEALYSGNVKKAVSGDSFFIFFEKCEIISVEGACGFSVKEIAAGESIGEILGRSRV